jgi:23S rRNA (guanine745-N1)-methyltransferase
LPAPLVCPVRGCGRGLGRSGDGKAWRCDAGHSFDVARSGYVNLLQPQDRRSKAPGDSREALLARARIAEAGLDPPVVAEVLGAMADAAVREGAAVLDVGCGDGRLLGELARARPIDVHGVDISVAAVELAVRRLPNAAWIVANADRRLPWTDASFDVVTSVAARRNGREFARVLRPGGIAVVAVPGPDDLAELRAAVQGEASERDRGDAVVSELAPHLELVSRRGIRSSARLDPSALRDLLAATYRGARGRERERVDALVPMTVTASREILVFRRS